MAELAGFFVARVAVVGSRLDTEPFALDADLGPLPVRVPMSGWRHSAVEDIAPPVGDATIERVGNELIAHGALWTETERGRETVAMLARLGPRAKFSVSYLIVRARLPSTEERRRGVTKVLTAVRLIELSPVLVPAEPATALLELKSTQGAVNAALKDLRDWQALREFVSHIRTEIANRDAAALFAQMRRTAA